MRCAARGQALHGLAAGGLGRVEEVRLVEHEPARLAVERFVILAQLAHDGLDAYAADADAGANRIDAPVVGLHGDLGAQAGVAGGRLDLEQPVLELGHLELEQAPHQVRDHRTAHVLFADARAALGGLAVGMASFNWLYGLLYWLLRGIRDEDSLALQLVVTGMHLAPEFGLTVRQIESDGFAIDERVPPSTPFALEGWMNATSAPGDIAPATMRCARCSSGWCRSTRPRLPS